MLSFFSFKTVFGAAGALLVAGTALAQTAEPSAADTAAAMERLRRAAQNTPAGAPAAATTGLANGATAINEVYEDWTVDCRIANDRKLCRLSQAQGNGQTRQTVFAIDLDVPRDNNLTGTVLMPLGVKLDAGAIVRLDDKPLGQGLRYSACVAQGCIAPLTIPAASVDALRKAQNISVASLNLQNDEPVVFRVSMKGFSAALDRLAQLAK
ncbi:MULTISPECIES: invasion associated locus B family protein [unclassified Beijerinckia]|uniref:invasion associated locus B family protein n=1 Tax=unclassified Beijerinckia TaxID=2638183 RepID=UPI0008944EEE|nr:MULTISPECIES: invasion associated locus B family protein [unclassified Beijerinckia]MDH7798184.1 invasion protein IalB [Beijerinckia sp. GAS462]SED12039.1 Invasion protein IalB, involved in pathogenesis [Beijerinckia sp. 28-YEA-48]